MRTTIEIDDVKLRKLRELAARRGEKGYSKLIDEALEKYFSSDATGADPGRHQKARQLVELSGAISADEADAMRAAVRESRRTWRSP